MSANWFESRIKYARTGEDGREKKIAESYLLDAMSYTEAEARMAVVLESMGQASYEIASLKKSNITEIVESNDGNDDKWYKARVALIDADAISGKEKSSYHYFLIAASTIDRALAHLQKSLSTYVIPYEIVSLSDTNIIDVLPYFALETDGALPGEEVVEESEISE